MIDMDKKKRFCIPIELMVWVCRRSPAVWVSTGRLWQATSASESAKCSGIQRTVWTCASQPVLIWHKPYSSEKFHFWSSDLNSNANRGIQKELSKKKEYKKGGIEHHCILFFILQHLLSDLFRTFMNQKLTNPWKDRVKADIQSLYDKLLHRSHKWHIFALINEAWRIKLMGLLRMQLNSRFDINGYPLNSKPTNI